jgi:hypothetical protein
MKTNCTPLNQSVNQIAKHRRSSLIIVPWGQTRISLRGKRSARRGTPKRRVRRRRRKVFTACRLPRRLESH